MNVEELIYAQHFIFDWMVLDSDIALMKDIKLDGLMFKHDEKSIIAELSFKYKHISIVIKNKIEDTYRWSYLESEKDKYEFKFKLNPNKLIQLTDGTPTYNYKYTIPINDMLRNSIILPSSTKLWSFADNIQSVNIDNVTGEILIIVNDKIDTIDSLEMSVSIFNVI